MDPQAMLAFLQGSGKLNERKARLFAAACCRRIWHLLTDKRSGWSLEVVERFADRLKSADELRVAAGFAAFVAEQLAALYSRGTREQGAFIKAAEAVQVATAGGNEYRVSQLAAQAVGETGVAEEESQSHYLRDLFGPWPFRPTPAINPAWLTWNDGMVQQLAETAYQERALPSGHLERERLWILADALTDAGCTDAALLDHLRGPGPHCRGCWAIDLLTGRE
jgi:hypothetical protein